MLSKQHRPFVTPTIMYSAAMMLHTINDNNNDN